MEVLHRCHMVNFSQLLLEQQLLLFGKVARLPDTSILRSSVLQPSSLYPCQLQIKKRHGRPHMNWITEVLRKAEMIRLPNLQDDLMTCIHNTKQWKSLVRYFCRNIDPFQSD